MAQIEIADHENYQGEEDNVFSHQSLVMKSMNKVIDLGTKELHEGCDIITQDPKTGKPIIVHEEDRRMAFINSIKMCKMLMVCDFDKEIKEKISSLNKELKDYKKELLLTQKKSWASTSNITRHKLNISFHPAFLNKNLPFLDRYKEKELQYYMDLFEELTLLTERKGFYAEIAYSA